MCQIPDKKNTSSIGLADIVRQHVDHYLESHTLSPEHHKVLNAIKNCRTALLGGHVDQCDQCHAHFYHYHSCRNRHCPQCGAFKSEQWLENRKAELLPVSYFHRVFTLPHELNHLVMYNKEMLYDLLFKSAWKSLKTLGANPNRLNGEMGMMAILHTWGQNLTQHNHVHCIVPAGALKRNGCWNASKKYLFPVQVISKVFRGIYVSNLRKLFQASKLVLPTSLSHHGFNQLLDSVMEKSWVVYAKKPFAGPEKLLGYLGRYTHKIAISNHRILSCDKDQVTFKWRDYADESKEKVMKLSPAEFIRRFLLHVLPSGFMRIRSFGFLANACKAKKIGIIQRQLNVKPTKKAKEKPDTATLMLQLTGKDITICPECHQGKLKQVKQFTSSFYYPQLDTS